MAWKGTYKESILCTDDNDFRDDDFESGFGAKKSASAGFKDKPTETKTGSGS